MPKSRKGFKYEPCNSCCSTRKMVPCCRKSNTARVENSAQKAICCSACDEPLPKLCKKHRYCYTGTSKEKREAYASLEAIARMLRAPCFRQRAMWLRGMLSHTVLFCSMQRRNMTRVTNNDVFILVLTFLPVYLGLTG